MKLLRSSNSKKAAKSGKNENAASDKDATFASDDAVYGTMPRTTKAKKKKFGLFKKKSKTPTTPDTVQDPNEDSCEVPQSASYDNDESYDYGDHIVAVIPVGEASPPGNNMVAATTEEGPSPPTATTEEEVHEDLPQARSLLTELDMADTDSGPDGSGEGTELILPSPTYEIDEEEEEDTDDSALMNEIVQADGNKNDTPANETPANETNEDAGDNSPKPELELNSKPRDDETFVLEENAAELGPLHCSMVSEDYSSEGDQQHQEPPTSPMRKILSAALSCNAEEFSGIVRKEYFSPVSEITTKKINLDTMFDEKTGSEFLEGLLNVGYTLIYHIAVDEESWVGRTVTMKLRPGVCSSRTIVQPAIEWNIMEGGKSNTSEIQSVGLLNIDTIAAREEEDRSPAEPSSLPISSKVPTNDVNNVSINLCSPPFPIGSGEDEFDCFFTITGQGGEIHLFEALNPEDCLRIVAGIQFIAQKLTYLLVEGDMTALASGFYDNTREPEESLLPQNEVSNRLSHAFLDGL